MKIISWQSVLTDHQVHTMRALQDVSQEPMVIISGVKELKERQLQGWTAPNINGLDVRYLAKSGWWKEGVAILCENRDSMHLFNGLWADRRFFLLLLEAQRRGIRTALMTEPYSEVAVGYLSEDLAWKQKLKSVIRPLLYRLAGYVVAKRLQAVFAISHKAVEQFSKIGVHCNRIFPFGYFIPALQVKAMPRIKRSGIKLIFVGSLIQRKGIQTLVEAMQICKRKDLEILLDVYGPGDAGALGEVDNIHYKGVIPFGQAQEVIAEYDVLVLPSQHDGWGVVVNEALLQGVPVIVSDQVGAKALVEKSGAGQVVNVGDAVALSGSFEELTQRPEILKAWESAAKSFQTCLSPEVAANYLHQCLLLGKNKKIDNPWYML